MAQSKLEVITMEKKVFLDYYECETVLHLKHMLYLDPEIRVRPSKQRIYYFGNLLEDHKTLGSYNIDANKFVLVMIHDTKPHGDNKMSQRKTRKVLRRVQEEQGDGEGGEGADRTIANPLDPLVQLSISDYELKSIIASKLCRSITKKDYNEIPMEDYFADYCTFAGYKEDPLFRNLVNSMCKPTQSTHNVEEAVQKLVDSNSKVLDLIYENLEEFLSLCCEPEKIGDTLSQ